MSADSSDEPQRPAETGGDARPGAPSDQPVADAVRLWGSEHPKLSGAAWRRSQRLERVDPVPPPGAEGGPASAPPAVGAATVDATAVSRAIEALRSETERRLSELNERIREVANSVREMASTAAGTDVRQELQAIRTTLARVLPEDENAPGAGGGLVAQLAGVEREIAEQTQRLGRALSNQADHLNRALESQTEAIRQAAEDVPEDAAPGVGRISAQIVGLTRAIADIRASMPGADDLGALLQSEIRGVRADLLRLKDGGELDRLQAVETRLGELAAAVGRLAARMEDLPPPDAFAEILRSEIERTRTDAVRSDEALRALVEDLRARADRIETDVSDLGTRYDAARTDPERVLSAIQLQGVTTRAELLRAAEVTDAKAREVLASIAREVLTLSDSQRDLREEVRRLAARIAGRT